MTIKVQTNFSTELKPKIYLFYILVEKHVSWEFCMRILTNIFHKNDEEASLFTDYILSDGEGLCGAYLYEIAESKAEIVKELAKKEGFTIQCLIEDV